MQNGRCIVVSIRSTQRPNIIRPNSKRTCGYSDTNSSKEEANSAWLPSVKRVSISKRSLNCIPGDGMAKACSSQKS